MNSLDDTLNRVRSQKGKGLIPYFTAGYPTMEGSRKLICEAAHVGSNALEIGIPFSDPLADGRSIQFSSLKALQNDVTIDEVFDLVVEIQQESSVPIVLMSYLNPVLQYGPEQFFKKGSQKGISGLVLVDSGLPQDNPQSKFLSNHSQRTGIHLIHLVAPTTPAHRLQEIAKIASGFIYLVSLTGVTGVRRKLASGFQDFTKKIRRVTEKLLYVGFGISTPGQAKQAVRYTDGIIVGSAIVEIIRNSRSEKERIVKVGKFIKEMKKSING